MNQLFQSFSGTHMMLLGGALLVGLFIIRRTGTRLATSRSRNPHSEVKREIIKREQAQRGSIEELEVRIHDFARDAEAKIQTRLAVLKKQTQRADATIEQLESMLSSLDNENLSEEQRQKNATDLQINQFANQLSAAGYSAEEVALMLGQPCVDDDQQGYSKAA